MSSEGMSASAAEAVSASFILFCEPLGLPLGLLVADFVDIAVDLTGLWAADFEDFFAGAFAVDFGLVASLRLCLAVCGLLCFFTCVNLEVGDLTFRPVPGGLPRFFVGVDGAFAGSVAGGASLRGRPGGFLTGGRGAVSVVLVAFGPGFFVGGGPILVFLML